MLSRIVQLLYSAGTLLHFSRCFNVCVPLRAKKSLRWDASGASKPAGVTKMAWSPRRAPEMRSGTTRRAGVLPLITLHGTWEPLVLQDLAPGW